MAGVFLLKVLIV